MRLFIKDMTESFAQEILRWKYESPYDFYNNESTSEALAELLEGNYHAVIDESNHLFGFFCTGAFSQVPAGIEYGVYKDEMIDIGLGMKPELTGKGLGYSFFEFILQHIENSITPASKIRLTVATFNVRAIKLYEKLGFITAQKFNSNSIEFQTMIKLTK